MVAAVSANTVSSATSSAAISSAAARATSAATTGIEILATSVTSAALVPIRVRPGRIRVRLPPLPLIHLRHLWNPVFVPPRLPKMDVRMDKWLWSVRLFKTRSLAAEACAAGKVRISGQPVKPARSVHPGEQLTVALTIPTGVLTRTVKVVGLIDKRVGAKLVPNYLEDHTPAEELAKLSEKPALAEGYRPPGTGRPTKRDRRILQSYFGEEPD